ncbi:hypothetical protein [Streptomyces monashensis]|uniref:Uncharacterized protein n=1 Tax=Streptomyces monashensis TaxID=1678012 RepID=A0A1S2PQR5_9ACTN|nr:hypothetical protein [Streptomyces monashensis]OIJ95906.1 hypothetical protein BIV23_33945 [Streptomyces monashensis]
MADWHWEPFQVDLLDGLPDAARAETERLADEIAVRESMVFLEGAPTPDRVPECAQNPGGC